MREPPGRPGDDGSTWHRRALLQAGAAASTACLGGRIGPARGGLSGDTGAVILLMLVGGPGPLDTFDPKPDAPPEVRGPFGSIATALPGVRVSEHLPGLARRLDRVRLIRTVHHDGPPIHEAGLHLLATGRPLDPVAGEAPHLGALAAARFSATRVQAPAFAVVPGPLGPTGVNVPRGQGSGRLGARFDPSFPPLDLLEERPSTLDAYGRSRFGRSCLMARRLVEAGSRMVIVLMAETVFDRPSWDAHGRRPFSTFDDLSRRLLPDFDRGFSALIDDLEARGRLASTLVVASGELGRAPWINRSGGRDHWTRAWSAIVAGGGTPGGSVIGATDARGGEPVDRPYPLADLAAVMARTLGVEIPPNSGPVV